MVDLDYLAKLLVILKGQGVVSFDDNGFQLMLSVEQSQYPTMSAASLPILNTQDHTVELPINEADLPPDLRTDNINSMDTILNWSTTPDVEEQPLPGTGEG